MILCKMDCGDGVKAWIFCGPLVFLENWQGTCPAQPIR